MITRSSTDISRPSTNIRQLNSSSAGQIGIAGIGSHLPTYVITNQHLAELIGQQGKGADWARDKLGIQGRRFMTPLDGQGKPVCEADELDMAEIAARDAL